MSRPASTPIPIRGIRVIALDPMNQSMNPIVKPGTLVLLAYLVRLLHLCAQLEITFLQQIE